MERPNIYKLLPKEYLQDSYTNPNKQLPIKHPFHLCIIGASGTGKTSSLIWLIEESKAFHKLYLYAKMITEPLYQYLIDEWESRSEQQGETLIEYSDQLEDVVSLQYIDEAKQNLIIFDDFIVEKNLKSVEELFIRGRKSNCSIIFISQSYFAIPKMIRQNSNYFILMQGIRGKDLISIATDNSSTSDNFQNLYRRYTKDNNFMLIDVANNRCYKNLGI